jgi:uncharacterized protein (TIGR02118 family)
MVRVHVWLRKKDGMSIEEFRDYWLSTHAPISRDGYENLTGYTVNLVTRVPEGQEAPYDGVAELTWETREGFSADMKSEANRRGTEDMNNFTSAVGLLFVDQQIVK